MPYYPPSGGGAGTVTGPGSSTDNAVARWNGTGGTAIQDSGVTVDDSNNITIPGTGTHTLGGSAAVIQVGGGATAATLRFMEPSGSGTNYSEFKAQAQTGNVTYTLPNADAVTSGSALISNGSGTLSWGSAEATQSEAESGSAGAVYLSPSVARYTPYVAKAWWQANGTGTIAVNGSYNLDGSTPLTDNGAGDYTVNFGVDFSAATYGIALAAQRDQAGSSQNIVSIIRSVASIPAVGSLRVFNCNVAQTGIDVIVFSGVTFGDWA